ncbi:MBL fold metallo-hydrolase [Candidatus Poribacteria bacterium]|nr:MBL fold metallo-hydrolase [Candidatus Poribacteria bacterium]
MILTIHRGSKQIGGSCIELRTYSGERILLDFGMPLTRPDGSDWPRGTMTSPSKELRAEGVLPDIEGLYADAAPEFSALVLSHSHLDHHGLAHHVHPNVPVYGSRGTIEMLKASRLFIPGIAIPADMRELPFDAAVAISSFAVRGIPVDHAAPDSRALLIEADGQRILYSGDLRAHGHQRHLFDSLPETAGPIDVLILEGTTVGQAQEAHGFPDEADVERRLSDLLKIDKGMVVVIASGQNIDRAISVYRAAIEAGRELVIDPYQAYILMKLKDICYEAPQFDWPSVRVKFIKSHVRKLKDAGLWSLACQMSRAGKVTSEQLASDASRFVYLARSSRATVALLRYLTKTARPTVVWSQWSGYLRKGGAVPRFCYEQGIEPVLIHSGGHAQPEDLAGLVSRLRPKAVVPIHTEAASHFADYMPNVRVLRDGEATEIASLIVGGGEAI